MITTTTTRLNGHAINNGATNTNRKPRRKKRWLPKADKLLFWSAALTPWCLALLLLGVSMPHLASGFQSICHCGALAGWLLAIAIDSAQVVAKLQLTLGKDYNLSPASKYTASGIIASTALMSMALNILAFLQGSSDLTGQILSFVAGIMIPVLILALSYTGSCFALTKKKTARTPQKKKK